MVVDGFSAVAIANQDPTPKVAASKEANRKVMGVEVNSEIEAICMNREHCIRLCFVVADPMEGAVPPSKTPVAQCGRPVFGKEIVKGKI
jgi:hypothetical protein